MSHGNLIFSIGSTIRLLIGSFNDLFSIFAHYSLFID
jgi:hypothetical protein